MERRKNPLCTQGWFIFHIRLYRARKSTAARDLQMARHADEELSCDCFFRIFAIRGSNGKICYSIVCVWLVCILSSQKGVSQIEDEIWGVQIGGLHNYLLDIILILWSNSLFWIKCLKSFINPRFIFKMPHNTYKYLLT